MARSTSAARWRQSLASVEAHEGTSVALDMAAHWLAMLCERVEDMDRRITLANEAGFRVDRFPLSSVPDGVVNFAEAYGVIPVIVSRAGEDPRKC